MIATVVGAALLDPRSMLPGRRRRQEESAVRERCEQQNEWLAEGDKRGMYGDFPVTPDLDPYRETWTATNAEESRLLRETRERLKKNPVPPPGPGGVVKARGNGGVVTARMMDQLTRLSYLSVADPVREELYRRAESGLHDRLVAEGVARPSIDVTAAVADAATRMPETPGERYNRSIGGSSSVDASKLRATFLTES